MFSIRGITCYSCVEGYSSTSPGTTDSLQCLPSPSTQWNVTCVGDETLLNKPRQRILKLMSINIADRVVNRILLK